MAYQLRWSKRASETLYKRVEYLAENRSEKAVTTFVDKVYHITDLLGEFPEMGQVLDKEKGIRSVLINPNVRLTYTFDGTAVTLLRFTDTRQNLP